MSSTGSVRPPTQQTPATIGLQIGPVDHDYRPLTAQQPPCHVGIDALPLAMQLSVAQQAVECLERGGDTLSAWPCPHHIGKGQAASDNEGFQRTQQHRLTQRMHAAK